MIRKHGLCEWQFFEPVYMAAFSIYRGSASALDKELKRRFGREAGDLPPSAGKAIEFTRSNGTRHYVLWLPETFDLGKSGSINTLAHEVFHLTMFVLMTRGVDATKDNHEPYCYLHGWLFEQCWRRLKGRR